MSYKQLLTDTTSEKSIRQEMMKWYEENKSENTTSGLAKMGLTVVTSAVSQSYSSVVGLTDHSSAISFSLRS